MPCSQWNFSWFVKTSSRWFHSQPQRHTSNTHPCRFWPSSSPSSLFTNQDISVQLDCSKATSALAITNPDRAVIDSKSSKGETSLLPPPIAKLVRGNCKSGRRQSGMGFRWGQGADGECTFVHKPGVTQPSTTECRECPGEFCNCLGTFCYCLPGNLNDFL